MQSNTTCPLIEQYLSYLVVIKGRAENTIKEYRTDLYIDQVNNDVLTVIGKGNKERKIFLAPAAKKSINAWLIKRNHLSPETKALFISRRNNRISTRAVQNIVKKYVVASGLDPKTL